MRKQYKYKREHFASKQEYEHFKNRMNEAKKRWLEKSESASPEKREWRLLYQRIYSRYYRHTDCRKTFSEWLVMEYDIEDIKSLSLDELKQKVSKC